MKNNKDPLVDYETKGTDSEEEKQSNMKLVRSFFEDDMNYWIVRARWTEQSQNKRHHYIAKG